MRRNGGDIIKFMGDGVLAIFPADGAGGTGRACRRALDTAMTARRSLPAINEDRGMRGLEPIDFGCALHFGEVTYGNIGSLERLDFTVIGSAVNVASRMQAYCKQLDEPVLLTAAVAENVDAALRSVGRHAIRGLSGDVELLVPTAD